MAGYDQAGHGHLFRNPDEYHRVHSVPPAHRKHGGVSQESSDRDDSSVDMRSGRCHDVRPAAGLLHPEADEKERAYDRGKAPARFLWFLQPAGRLGHSAPVVGLGRFLSLLADWRFLGFAAKATVLS